MLKPRRPGAWDIKIERGLPNTCSADKINIVSNWEHREKTPPEKIYFPQTYPSKIPH